ncbi:MAG: GAF domain-containing protein [Polyangiaceae bacterium]
MYNPSADARIRRMVDGRSRVLERIAVGAPLRQVARLLTEVCEELDPEVIATVRLFDARSGCLVQCGKSRLPQFFVEALEGLRPGPFSACCGTAAFTAARVVVEDVFEDARWGAFVDVAQRANLRACWAQPILSAEGVVQGAFAMYYATPHRPTPEDIDWLEGCAHIASIAIEKAHDTDELACLRAHLQTVVAERTAALEHANRELREALGKIQALYGLLPICASCKAIRNDAGDWEELESYLAKRTAAEFSHGICPDCASQLYPRHSEVRLKAAARESEIREAVAARKSS